MKAFRSLVVLVVLAGCLHVGMVHAQVAPTAASTLPGKWQLMPPWLLLQRGMTQQEVSALVGEPSEESKGSGQAWIFSDPTSGQSASMMFKNGGLYSWESPRFVTKEGANNTKWKSAGAWGEIVQGMSREQVEKALGTATWVSTGNGSQSWFYYDTATGKTGSLGFKGTALYSWVAPTF